MRMPQLSGWVRLVLVVTAAMILLNIAPAAGTQAQIGGTIGYGSSVFGSIAAGQSLTFSFSGGAGDYVLVSLRNWTGTLDPHFDLVTPDGQIISSTGTHLASVDPLEAALSIFLPQSGIYSLQIGGAGSTTGEFVLKLTGHGAVTPTELIYGQRVDVNVPVNPPPQYFSFEAQDCPTVLVVINMDEGLPYTFPFTVKVHNGQGMQIAQLYGGDALEDRLTVAPSSGRYEVIVSSADIQIQGMIQLLVTCGDQAPPCLGSESESLCTPCFDDQFGGEQCAALSLSVSLSGNIAAFTWLPVEGADWYIFSIIDSSGTLLADSPRLLEGETSNTYTFNPADLVRGPFTVFVNVGSETDDPDLLCTDSIVVSFDGTTTAACAGMTVGADIVPGAERAAVVHWDGTSGAAAYLIHVYAISGDGGRVGIRVLTAPGDATTYHLTDLFPSDYDHFEVRVAAYAEATGGGAFGDMPQEYLCDGSTDILFEPTGPVHWGPGA